MCDRLVLLKKMVHGVLHEILDALGIAAKSKELLCSSSEEHQSAPIPLYTTPHCRSGTSKQNVH